MRVSDLEKDEKGRVKYRGKWYYPDKPVKSTRKGKKMMVLAVKYGEVRLIHFGATGYRHNHSIKARENYLRRSAGIIDANGNLTKDDKHSANYWSRKHLWEE